jgi:metal-responsive CopG/Arc/MetJ family transcriptional regulator
MATTVKTAISIQKSLFEQAESLAQKLNISRSHLFGLALEAFLANQQNQKLLEAINRAYAEETSPEERQSLAQMRRSHRALVENEW